jgi:hypothetical protein
MLFVASCLLTGLALTLCQSGLIPASAGVLFFDGLIYGVLFGILTFLLWFVVLFADLSGGNPFQKVVNHTALLVLLLLIWTGGGYLLEQLFFPRNTTLELSKSISLKTVFGFLAFLSVLRMYLDWKRLKLILEEETSELMQNKIPENLEHSKVTRNRLEKISVKNGQKIHVIVVSDVFFLQADGDYVMIHSTTGRFLKEQTMKYFEENLSVEKFVRIHRSCIVNVDHISRIELYEKQNYRITLKNGQQLKASPAGYKLLKSTLQL